MIDSIDPVGSWKTPDTVFVAPECDRPFLKIDEHFRWETFEYENLVAAHVRGVVPRRAILFPIKRSLHLQADYKIAQGIDVMRNWLRGGSHLIAIVPNEGNDQSQFSPEQSLRSGVIRFLNELVPGANLYDETPKLPPRAFHRGCVVSSIEVRSAFVKFGLSTGKAPLKAFSSLSDPSMLDALRASREPRVEAGTEVLARNDAGLAIAVSIPVGRARLTVVPRGMFSGELDPVNRLIPAIEVIESQSEPTIQGIRERLAAASEGLATAAKARRDEVGESRPRSSSRRGKAESIWGYKRARLLVNRRQIEVPARGWLVVMALWNAELVRLEQNRPDLGFEWPPEIRGEVVGGETDSVKSKERQKTARKNIIRQLRDALDRQGVKVLRDPTSGTPLELAPEARAGVVSLRQGFELVRPPASVLAAFDAF